MLFGTHIAPEQGDDPDTVWEREGKVCLFDLI